MATLKTIAPPISRDFSDTNFEEEMRELVIKRFQLFFAIGIFATIVIFFADKYFVMPYDKVVTEFSQYRPFNIFVHTATFVLSWIYLRFAKQSLKTIRAIMTTVLVLNFMFVSFEYAVHRPNVAPTMPLVLMMFLHAAFIPCLCRYQWILIVTAVISYVFSQLWSYSFIKPVQDFWWEMGGLEFYRANVIDGTLGLFLLGLISGIVNKTLYQMRRELRSAKKLGNYIIKEQIGAGGMGRVYTANHHLMCRSTAVKVLKAGSDSEAQAQLNRFEREVRLSSTLTHPNTITIYDYGRTDDFTFYYAMEHLEGLDLQQFVEKFGPLPAERVVYIAKQICGSLHEAHTKNIIHRDIKPSNIFLTHRGGMFDFVKVLDFGLAKQVLVDQKSGVTKTGAFFGTPTYIAPEMVYGADKIDHRVDIYNLGAVMYFMLTGTPPFSSEKSIEVMIDHVKTKPLVPSKISEQPISAELDAVVMTCLEKDPNDRWGCAKALIEELSAISFKQPWGKQQARAWWELHMPMPEEAPVCADKNEKVVPISEAAKDKQNVA